MLASLSVYSAEMKCRQHYRSLWDAREDAADDIRGRIPAGLPCVSKHKLTLV